MQSAVLERGAGAGVAIVWGVRVDLAVDRLGWAAMRARVAASNLQLVLTDVAAKMERKSPLRAVIGRPVCRWKAGDEPAGVELAVLENPPALVSANGAQPEWHLALEDGAEATLYLCGDVEASLARRALRKGGFARLSCFSVDFRQRSVIYERVGLPVLRAKGPGLIPLHMGREAHGQRAAPFAALDLDPAYLTYCLAA